jgi:hypothetical protein
MSRKVVRSLHEASVVGSSAFILERSRNAQAHLSQSNNLRLSTARTSVSNKKATRTRPVPRCRGSPGHIGRILGSPAENGRET